MVDLAGIEPVTSSLRIMAAVSARLAQVRYDANQGRLEISSPDGKYRVLISMVLR
jgi:hypothetical protein